MKGLEEQEEARLEEKQLVEDLSSSITLIVTGLIKLYKIIERIK